LVRFILTYGFQRASQYLGGQEIVSVNDDTVNLGLVVGAHVSWNYDVTNDALTISTTVSNLQAGIVQPAESGAATFYFLHGNWSSINAGGDASGRFRVDEAKSSIKFVGSGKSANGGFAFQMSGVISPNKLFELVDMNVNGFLSVALRLRAVSELVFKSFAANAGRMPASKFPHVARVF
jgi:hypothetical protein